MKKVLVALMVLGSLSLVYANDKMMGDSMSKDMPVKENTLGNDMSMDKSGGMSKEGDMMSKDGMMDNSSSMKKGM